MSAPGGVPDTLSVQDYFASQAMIALVGRLSGLAADQLTPAHLTSVAAQSYTMADAMMDERDRRSNK